jgi:hypothetical protein
MISDGCGSVLDDGTCVMLSSGIDTESTAGDVVEVGSNTDSMSVELATTTGAIVVGIDSGSEVEMGAGS